MADIELVIKIPEEYYSYIKNISDFHCTGDMLIIKNGIPLPKGHGRLIDADALNRKNVNCANVPMNFIDIAPTIIEADSEIHCNFTDSEIARSFISDVEAVKDLLPNAESEGKHEL